MILPDVNVLIYAFNPGAARHAEYLKWLEDAVAGPEGFAVCDLVLSAFVRIVTQPKVLAHPASVQEALDFVEAIRSSPYCVVLSPGQRHWEIFVDLCRRAGVRGGLVSDAYFAALAIENGCIWITNDRDYARFPQLALAPSFGWLNDTGSKAQQFAGKRPLPKI